jgi:hypothetical protein
MHAGDAVADRHDAADLGDIHVDRVVPICSRMILEISSALMFIKVPP